ncbi:hypothetical protein BH24ACT2_BH24ACT2_19360 [soil metagenome]
MRVVGVTLQALDEAVNGLELGLDGDELVALPAGG